MAKKKGSTPRKPQNKKDTPMLLPAVPPPDDPLLRSTEFDAHHEYHSKEMAEKRLEALRYTREMPTSDEAPPPTTEETPQTTEDPPASPEQFSPGSTEDD
jgi:hypothetical protein